MNGFFVSLSSFQDLRSHAAIATAFRLSVWLTALVYLAILFQRNTGASGFRGNQWGVQHPADSKLYVYEFLLYKDISCTNTKDFFFYNIRTCKCYWSVQDQMGSL